MAHTLTHLLTHVVFGTKERAPLIIPNLRPHLHAYMGGIIREMNGTALAVGGTSDHVHLLIVLPPVLSVSEAMRVVKTNSSRWVKETYRITFGWQSGYGAFSVSQSNAADVSSYIARQEGHHRKVTFQEEFVVFLKRHGVEYDERYLWS
jgi:REP element-mobilizing transposase RayT